MKLCWLLGVVTVALCECNDIIRNTEIVSTTESTLTNKSRTTVKPQEPPPGDTKKLTKRQIEENVWIPLEKRTKFSSWAGKRDPEDSKENKRAKFSSWAGKRTPEENVDPPVYSKRANKFSSWAGKRDGTDYADKIKLLQHVLAGYSYDPSEENDIADGEFNEEKRKFSSWGGKRSDVSYENKRKFSSWSGKRSINVNPLNGPFNYIENPQEMLSNNDLSEEDFRKYILGKIEQKIKEKNLGNDVSKNIYMKDLPDEGEDGIKSYDDKRQERGSKFYNWGGKRKFSSWGGKRSDIDLEDTNFMDSESHLGTDKRSKFSSWGGKRGLLPIWRIQYQGKRGKFSSWAGKRSDPEMIDDTFDEDKRTKFSNWGGKRAVDQSDSYENKRATKFSSWAGKRSYDTDDEEGEYFNANKRNTYYTAEKKKLKGRGFSSWGGKRSYFDDDNDNDLSVNQYDPEVLDEIKRATKFSSWAGKRNQLFEDKRKFSSWGGKRDYDEPIEESKRTKFSSWAGKRSVDPGDGPIEEKRKDENNKNGLLRRYNRFNSWRGKKDNITPNNSTKLTNLEDVNFNQSSDTDNLNKSKRGISNYIRQFDTIKRNPLFRAWMGRNYPDIPLITWKRRQAFSSWGGKRSMPSEAQLDMEDNDINAEKRKFSSWGGKRDHNIEKRSIKGSELYKRLKPIKKDLRMNNLLGGRSSVESRYYQRGSKDKLLHAGDRLLASAIRPLRRQFYAWGGKRSSIS